MQESQFIPCFVFYIGYKFKNKVEMKMIYKFSAMGYIIAMIGATLLTACGSSKGPMMPDITGSAYEILVVMEEDAWEGAKGDSLRGILQKDMPGLPQTEPYFNIIQIPAPAFNKLYLTYRSILRVRISNHYPRNEMLIKRDAWAKNQLYVELNTRSDSAFYAMLATEGNKLLSLFLQTEKERLIGSFNTLSDQNIQRQLNSKYNINLSIPNNYTLDVTNDTFAWLSHETPKLTQSILIWRYAYKDTSQLGLIGLLNKRDEMLKTHVPGPRTGSYMTTEHEYPTHYTILRKKDIYTVELRGLWRLEGDYMGGPFVSQTTIDTATNTLITVEGFVYAGNQNKRNFLRQVEAIVNSLKIYPPKKE